MLVHHKVTLPALNYLTQQHDIMTPARVWTAGSGFQHANYYAVPENIHTSPTEGIFLRLPSTLLEILIKLHTFLLIFGSYITPPGNSNPFCGGSRNIFWNWTIQKHNTNSNQQHLLKSSPANFRVLFNSKGWCTKEPHLETFLFVCCINHLV